MGHIKVQKLLVGSRVHGAIRLHWNTKILRIRVQCTPRGTHVGILIVAVTISNMALARKDYVGVKHAAAIQQIHRTVEVK